ncbi:MAG: hypothetical protein A3J97_11350 [Spirochaetes bacterium RIFOXYC1_FULL_54_7]|nr:MAG: hypothetical protein A3J97_11350 [Spirochaetes bacterium RIFOXYC1_FULL_54_7]
MNIKVYVRLFASLRKWSALPALELELDPPASARSALATIGIPEEEIMVVMINGKRGNLYDHLTSGDELQFFPLLGGG